MKRSLLVGVVAVIAVAEIVYLVRSGWFHGGKAAELGRSVELPRSEFAAQDRRAEPEVQLEVPPTPAPAAQVVEEAPPVAPRVEAPITHPDWVQSILDSPPARWSEKKNDLSRDDRVALKIKIYGYIGDASKEEFARRREAREWELIAPPDADGNMKYAGNKEDDRLIFQTVMLKGEGVFKVTLPREQFAELYALKEKADALL